VFGYVGGDLDVALPTCCLENLENFAIRVSVFELLGSSSLCGSGCVELVD